MTTIRSGREGSVMLQYPLHTNSNYTTWSIRMCVNLQTHGVWDVIEHGEEVEERRTGWLLPPSVKISSLAQ